ncbi:MAG: hypothetical protein JNL34_17425 [Anaerolineae bacterium]|nr:hypothetical protein [Anaerolineae bacterium]
MKRWSLPLILFALCATSLFPAQGQAAATLAGWAPADTQALLQVNLANRTVTLNKLNVGLFIGSYLQPMRPPVDGVQPFDAFFPLDMLDLESASFAQLVLPWLGDSLALAYRTLDLPDGVNPDDVLLILPASDSFEAAAALSGAVAGQDLLRPEVSPGGALYVGDQSAIALTPSVVLIGGEALVRAALAAGAGEAPSLAEAADYQAITAALPAQPDVSLFMRGASAASALPALLSLNGEAAPLLASYGSVLASQSGIALPASLLLQGEAEALGVALDLAVSRSLVSAEIALLMPDEISEVVPDFREDLLHAVPRSAMLVYSTANAALLTDKALAALPFASSGPSLLSALPLQPSTAAPPPSSEDARFALSGLLSALDVSGASWDALRGGFSGSAVLALLPRPNNPLPVTLSLADVLLIAESGDAEGLAASFGHLLTALQLPVEPVTADDGSVRYQMTVEGADEPLLQFGAQDGLFLLGTGQVLDEAQRALAGDNRLIDQPRWDAVGAPAPGLYLDVDRLYNTFLPTAGGSVAGPVNEIGFTGSLTDDGVVQLSAVVAVTLSN